MCSGSGVKETYKYVELKKCGLIQTIILFYKINRTLGRKANFLQ